MKTAASKILGMSVAAILLAGEPVAQAGLYGFDGTAGPGAGHETFTAGGTSLNQTIADNNPVGVGYSFNLTAPQWPTIESVSVSFNISGGYNGDLYAYLSHGSDFTVLLNRVGTTMSDSDGYGNTGFNVTLTGSGYNIHNYQANPDVAYNGSGQLVNQQGASPYTAYAADDGTGLGKYAGSAPSGSWTIFFADLAAGSVSTLNSFEIDIVAVPEPITIALGIFGAAFGAVQFWSWRKASSLRSA